MYKDNVVEKKDRSLSPTMQRIIFLMDKPEFIEFFHIKRENNKPVDEQVNQAIILEQSVVRVEEGVPAKCHIP